MLVLSRKAGESIYIGDNVLLTVSAISGNRVKICVEAPKQCAIRRGEIYDQAGSQIEKVVVEMNQN
ncbi:carbon storage regulator [Planctomicrobium sp. SH668]|uniref:carbon storage regulator n=1 Tax=Planctomicrobium sp. SH668 TaxID=3448126 RepID=UPI003F5BA9C0